MKIKFPSHFQSILVLSLGWMLIQCNVVQDNIPDHEIAAQWADMTLYVTKNTPANSPTFASRCLGYMGLAQYEAVVHGDIKHQSLVGQLNELNALPLPKAQQNYNWLMVLNRSQSTLLKSIYIQTSDENKLKIDSLEKRIHKILLKSIDGATAKRSLNYGDRLANELFEWSKTD